MYRKKEPQTIFTAEKISEAHLRKPHACEYHDGNDCFGYCEEKNGRLNLVIADYCECQGMYVPICPFCGFKLEN